MKCICGFGATDLVISMIDLTTPLSNFLPPFASTLGGVIFSTEHSSTIFKGKFAFLIGFFVKLDAP